MAYNFNTFGSVVDEAYRELSLDATSTTVPGLEQSEMEAWANRFSKIFLEKVHLKSQYDTSGFSTLVDDTLGAAAASGATSITLTTSNATLGWPTSGIVLINGIPYAYTNIVTTTMTIEALDKAFDAGAVIQVGYAVPTNYGKPVSLFVESSRHEPQKWGNEETIESQHFSVFNDYIFLPAGITASQEAVLHFYKKATNTLTSGSTNEIYQMWDAYVIYRLAARGHRLLYDTGRAQEYEQMAKEMLNAARSQVAMEDLSVNRGFTPDW